MQQSLSTLLLVSVGLFISIGLCGCTGARIPLGGRTVNPEFLDKDGVVIEQRVNSLQAGMCKDEVFDTIGIDQGTQNIRALDPRKIDDMRKLLNGRIPVSNNCLGDVGNVPLPYTGLSLPIERTKEHGWFSGLKWKISSHGAQYELLMVFFEDSLNAWQLVGQSDMDEVEHMYLWKPLFQNPTQHFVPQP